jgi:hypothetical protein
VAHNQPRSRKSPLISQRQLITVREVAPTHFQLKGKGFLKFGGPLCQVVY